MSEPEEPSNEEIQPIDAEWVNAQLGMLKKIIFLLALAALLVSAALNLYVVFENSSLKNAMVDYRQVRDQVRNNDIFMRSLIRDLQFLGQKDEEVQKLLTKYSVGGTPASSATQPFK